MNYYTSAARQEILDQLIEALKQDKRITGLILVGSGAVGFDDEYSDIDLSVVVGQKTSVESCWRDWIDRIYHLLPVTRHFEVVYSEANFLYGFFLENFLEIDIGFLHAGNLVAKRPRWKVIYDQEENLSGLMESSWEDRALPDPIQVYKNVLSSIWYHITHAAICIMRKHVWQALYFIEKIRSKTFLLCILICEVDADPDDYRHIDRLPAVYLDRMNETLLTNLDQGSLCSALNQTV